MNFYHNLITKKSWQTLKNLNKNIDFILIDGWAVFLYAETLKSKDIDIIINFDQLSQLKKSYSVYKNERLKKYEAVKDEVQIDIYLPHFSHLGIPVEDLINQFQSYKGFKVLDINYLFVLKIYTLSQRQQSPKGRKDFIDLISLWLTKQIEAKKAKSLLKNYQMKTNLEVFFDILKENTHLPELDLSSHKFAKIRADLQSNIYDYDRSAEC